MLSAKGRCLDEETYARLARPPIYTKRCLERCIGAAVLELPHR